MPRGRTYDPRSTSGLTSDQLRSVALIPGLPQTFLAILENLREFLVFWKLKNSLNRCDRSTIFK